MFVVELIKDNKVAYKALFNSEERAIKWAESHNSGIKDYKISTDFSMNRSQKIKDMIKRRDHILCATDWIFLPDVKFDQKHRRIYMEYRQLLRDIPQKLRDHKPVTFEAFDHWLRRNYPEEFMDGGNGQKIIYRFNYYVEEKK